MGIKALLMDFDGTITKFKIDYDAARENAVSYLRSVNFGDGEIVQERSIYNILSKLRSRTSLSTYETIKRKLYKYFEEVEITAAEEAELLEGVSEVLASIQSIGLKIALITNNSRKGATKALEKLGITNYFDVIITRDEAKELKPDGDGIRKALDYLSVHPDDTILIGDSTADVQAAKSSRIRSIAIPTGPISTEKLRGAQPDYLLNDIRELISILATA